MGREARIFVYLKINLPDIRQRKMGIWDPENFYAVFLLLNFNGQGTVK